MTNNIEEAGMFLDDGNEDNNDSKKVYRVDDVINSLGLGIFQFFLFCYCGLFCVAQACDTLMLTLLIPILRSRWDLSPFSETMIVVSTGLGDSFGRLPALYISSITMILFNLLSALFDNSYVFIIVRFFVGFSIGSVIIPHNLLIEYLPLRFRGLILGLFCYSWAIGTLYENFLGWLILPNAGDRSWQIYVAISTLPVIIAFPFTFCVPESIRYLVVIKPGQNIKKKRRQIGSCIRSIERGNCKKLSEEEYEVKLVSSEETNLISDLWNHPRLFLILVNICVFVSLAMIVFLAFMLITPDLFDTGDVFDEKNWMYIGTIATSVIQFPALLIFSGLIVIIRRKILQASSFVIVAFGIIALAFPVDNVIYKVIFAMIAQFGVTISNNITIIIGQESLPTNIRGSAFGIAYATATLSSSFGPVIAKWLGRYSQGYALAILCFLCLLGAFSTFVHPVETKGLLLEDVYGEDKSDNNNIPKKIKKKKNGEEESNQSLIKNDFQYISSENGSVLIDEL